MVSQGLRVHPLPSTPVSSSEEPEEERVCHQVHDWPCLQQGAPGIQTPSEGGSGPLGQPHPSSMAMLSLLQVPPLHTSLLHPDSCLRESPHTASPLLCPSFKLRIPTGPWQLGCCLEVGGSSFSSAEASGGGQMLGVDDAREGKGGQAVATWNKHALNQVAMD